MWLDEAHVHIGKEGYKLLIDLWIVRGYIHRGIPPERWELDPVYFQDVWRNALRDIPGWIGFKRLTLSSEDRALLERSLKEAARGIGY
ncbi:hypothetical protein [Chondromyces crocatus]|uniref:hypothetical protein n=1 Tax=Chondromyces crocatus TaxID=52 RepID=UPI00147045D1|nr:hypothetical protein [Chondromyces crocatus]